MKKFIAISVLLLVFFVSGCSNGESENVARDTTMLSQRDDTQHNYQYIDYYIGDYQVLRKEKGQCQMSLLNVFYIDEDGVSHVINDSGCVVDPTFYMYINSQYLMLNEAIDLGYVTDEQVQEGMATFLLNEINVE